MQQHFLDGDYSDFTRWNHSNAVPVNAVVGINGIVYYHGVGYNHSAMEAAIERTIDGYGTDNDAPYFYYKSPGDGFTNVAPDKDIKARMKDDGFGIDVDTITIEVTYTGSSGPVAGDLDEESGSNFLNYRGVFDPDADLPLDTLITVTVNATDLESNVMPTEVWTYTTAVTGIEKSSLGGIKATFK